MNNAERQILDVGIDGMTCAMCAKAIENSLADTDGVLSSNVNLASEFVRIEYNPDTAGFDKIKNSIETAGYSLKFDSMNIKIDGMTCVMCQNIVEKTLLNLNFIKSAKVDFNTSNALIEYYPAVFDKTVLKAAIENAGYNFIDASDEEPISENHDKSKLIRAIVGFAVSIPMMLFMFFSHIHSDYSFILFIITTPIFLWQSFPIFKSAFNALKNKSLNMEVMYSMGIGSAYLASVLGTFNFIFSHDFMFYDTVLMLASFLLFGKHLESKAKSKTSTAIKQLIKLSPKKARIEENGSVIEKDIDFVKIDDIIHVLAGDKIPVDGIIIDGCPIIDESMINGEPIPKEKVPGDNVIAGTINLNDNFKFKAQKIGKDTILSQIIEYVTKAQMSKPQIQQLADKAVVWFIPIVFAVAIISFLINYLIIDEGIYYSFRSLVSVLVIACPCALGLATPTAVSVGLGRAAKEGILIKDSSSLETISQCKYVVLDKTGTITQGKPAVKNLLFFNGFDESILQNVVSAEFQSQHPLAKAIVNYGKNRKINPNNDSRIETLSGKGIKAIFDDNIYLIGSFSFMLDNNINIIEDIENTSTMVYVVINKIHAASIIIEDELKSDSKTALELIKNTGRHTVMITGDNKNTAQKISESIGLDEYFAEVLPAQKAEIINNYQKKSAKVIFIGDGINDAPALTKADIGIAMGSGTDIALESGDIALTNSNLTTAYKSIILGEKVYKRIKQNVFWAFFYNVLLIPVASGLLHRPFGLQISPEIAGIAMALSSITVISMSLSLRSSKL